MTDPIIPTPLSVINRAFAILRAVKSARGFVAGDVADCCAELTAHVQSAAQSQKAPISDRDSAVRAATGEIR